MTRFQVDSDAVLGATTAVRASSERIRAEVAGLLAQLTGLEGSWSGTAASAFQGIVGEWRTTQAHVEQSLDAITQATALAAQQYADIEFANARLFGR